LRPIIAGASQSFVAGDCAICWPTAGAHLDVVLQVPDLVPIDAHGLWSGRAPRGHQTWRCLGEVAKLITYQARLNAPRTAARYWRFGRSGPRRGVFRFNTQNHSDQDAGNFVSQAAIPAPKNSVVYLGFGPDSDTLATA
jgi:hypothetical protein